MLTETLFVIFLVILTIFLLVWIQNRSKRSILINEIPGPPGYPIVGNLLNIVSAGDLWCYFRKLGRDYYPIYKLWNGYIASVALLHPDDIEVILSSTKHLRKTLVYQWLQPWLGTGLLTSTGTKWKSRRKILTPAFHFNILQEFTSVFIEQSQHLVDKLENECHRSHTEIIPIITEFTLHSICETAMGTRLDASTKRAREYVKAIYRMGELITLRIRKPWLHLKAIHWLSPLFEEQKNLVNVLHKFSRQVIEERERNFVQGEQLDKGKKRLALLDLLISAKNSNKCIEDEGIREEVDTFMFEGHDTTTSAICFALMALANLPDIQEKVARELHDVLKNEPLNYSHLQKLNYLEMVLKESLRMFPSVPLITRITDEDIRTTTGYVIPSDTFIHIHIYDLHHNPEFYPEPHKFDPERFSMEKIKNKHPFSYLPFSAGPRNCIGQKYAMLELKTAIASILKKYRLRPIDKIDDISMMVHLVLKTKAGIKIKFEKRDGY